MSRTHTFSTAEREAAKHLLSFFPDIPLSIESYLKQRDIAQDRLWPTVQLLPGVKKLVQHLHAHNIAIAVATGTRRRNFIMKTAHLSEVFGCFDGKVVCGDDFDGRIKGKPNADIFLITAKEMLDRDVGDEECTEAQIIERARGLVFEDALPGVQAGKRAGMSGTYLLSTIRSYGAELKFGYSCVGPRLKSS